MKKSWPLPSHLTLCFLLKTHSAGFCLCLILLLCGSHCCTNTGRYISKHKNLRSIPINIPQDTVLIDLGHNKIVCIPTRAFPPLPKLCALALGGNPIATIEPYAFQGLTSLQDIRLSSTKLTHLQGDMFAGLPALKYIGLVDSPLATISPFCGLPRPLVLGLRNNALVCDDALCWLRKEAEDEQIIFGPIHSMKHHPSFGLSCNTSWTCEGRSQKKGFLSFSS